MERQVLRSHIFGPTLPAFLTGESGIAEYRDRLRTAGVLPAPEYAARMAALRRAGFRMSPLPWLHEKPIALG